MTDTNPAKFTKLVTLLKELFQLDQPDLDFGIYRIMHAKAGEVTQFLERDLLPQVKDAFAGYQTADKSVLQAELAKAIEQAQALGADPDSLPKVKELRERIANEAVDIGALESETYDHLYSFFRRYYSEGDFLAKRVYKPGVYAIPYEGEEVTLHWANKDQYYIKTSEYLRDYAFRLKPEAGQGEDPMRVRFKLVDAAEGEHGNVKAAEGKDRVFVLAHEDFIAEVDGELELRFEYRPATLEDWPAEDREGKKKPPTQKELTGMAVQTVLGAGSGHAQWLETLATPHVKTDGEQAEYSRLEAHLRRYAARNTFDYFIHKDLGTFLRRELDFYIKNEVMHLDDVESETAPKVEQYLSKIKVVRRIAGKIIDFLAQLENFQKKLWLKKKFVVGSDWLVAMSQVPDELLADVCANTAQLEEWKGLHSLHELPGDVTLPAYSEPLTPEYLKANSSLMLDTRRFDSAFVTRLLNGVGDLDDKADGVLVHSENFQALSLMQARYRDKVQCIYIDPPYNTGADNDFAYKDNYQSSSWISLIEGRCVLARSMATSKGGLFVSTDDGEYANLKLLLEDGWGRENFVADIIWNSRKSVSNDALISISTNHTTFFAKSKTILNANKADFRLPQTPEGFSNPDNDPRGPWKLDPMDAPNVRANLSYEIVNPDGGETFLPPRGRCWRFEKQEVVRLLQDGRILFGRTGAGRPMYKRFLSEAEERGRVPTTLWDDVQTTTDGTRLLLDMFGESIPRDLIDRIKPKPTALPERCLQLLTDSEGVALDFFAGSGTTAHATINLNRSADSRRRFIMADFGSYFDVLLVPRIKKVAFAPEWREGIPGRTATREEQQRSPRLIKVLHLESYEDTLNNIAMLRSTQQQSALDFNAAQGDEGLREQYLLRYQLDVESRGSASLLNIAEFTDPTAYKLLVKTPGSDESREVNVDLLETFNWLLGLTVQHIAAPRSFVADFERDGEGRLHIKGRLKQDAAGPWWFRTVTGTTPEGRKTLVIWRKLTGNAEQDNVVLDTWFRDKQAFSVRDTEFDLIYVNGDNTLENIRLDDESWKVRLTEEDFQRLMFEGTE